MSDENNSSDEIEVFDDTEEVESPGNLRRVNTEEIDEEEVRDSFVFRESDADFRESEVGPPRDSTLEYRDTDIIMESERDSLRAKKKGNPSFFQIIIQTIGVVGVSFCWCMYLVSVRGFMVDMGINENIVRWWIYLVPPIVNMFSQIFVGFLSDCCYAPFFGRRKIYFTHADWIGIYVFNVLDLEILFVFLTFPFVIFSLSSCFLLMRAVISDVVPSGLLVYSNASFNFFYSIGFLLALAVAVIPFPLIIPFFSYSMKVYFYISFLIITVPFCCCFCCFKEERYVQQESLVTSRLSFEEAELIVSNQESQVDSSSDDDDDDDDDGHKKTKRGFSVRTSIFQRAKSIRYTFYLAIVIQFFSYFGRQTILYFAVDFFEYQIIEPSLDGYIWGYLSLVAYFLVSATVSPILAGMNFIVPSKYIWLFSSALQTIGMLSFPFVYNSYLACAIFGIFFTERESDDNVKVMTKVCVQCGCVHVFDLNLLNSKDGNAPNKRKRRNKSQKWKKKKIRKVKKKKKGSSFVLTVLDHKKPLQIIE